MARLLRLDGVLDRTGQSRTPFYNTVKAGLFTKPVKVDGGRAAGWPESEVDQLVALRIAGADSEVIRKLVDKLHRERLAALTSVEQ